MSGQVILSDRMQAVANMVTKGNRVCDVGCDHGYVSIYLVEQKIAPSVLAMDINKGPLQRAAEHVEEAGLSKYITLRLSDGLLQFHQKEADTLICAGMGGRLMQKILEREIEKSVSFQELILQPQSELAAFRKFLVDVGYSIVDEDMILEEGKFYPIIKAIPRKGEKELTELSELSELEARFGPVLLEKKHSVLASFLEKEWKSDCTLKRELEAVASESNGRIGERLKELEKQMEYVRQAAEICGLEVFHGNNYD